MSEEDEEKYIRYNWYSYDPALIAVAGELAERWRDDNTPQRRTKRDFESAFNVVLTAAEVLGAYDGMELRIPVNNSLYSGKLRRSSTYNNDVKDVVIWLRDNEYLHKVHGVQFTKRKKGEKQRQLPYGYQLSEKWLSEIAAKPLSSLDQIRRNPAAGFVELNKKVKVKGQDKPTKCIIEITETHREEYADLINESNKLLAKYDDFMSGTALSIGSKPIPSLITTTTRIFNNASFEQGGRLYSQIQNTKTEARPYIYFDGEPTIEIDYGSLHPHLLYHSEGLEFSGDDPYTIEGIDRDDVKIAFNTMINRTDNKAKPSAASSIAYYLDCDMQIAEKLEAAILELHSPIKHYFNTGYGLKLQRLDSDVAMKIIGHFINVMHRPIFGVHDSFIVSVRDTEALKLLMDDCYNALFTEQNDTAFDAIGVVEGGGIGGVVGMRKVSAKHLDFSKPLMKAIERCFEGDTEGMDDEFWDALLAVEAVQETKA